MLHLIAPAPFGGAESVVRMLAAGQQDRGRLAGVVALLAVENSESDLIPALHDAGVTVKIVRTRPRAYRAQYSEIVTAIKDFGPTVVHCHGYRGIVLGLLASRKTKTPVVGTAHGYSGGGWKNRFYEGLDQRSLRYMGGVIAVSRAIEERLLQVGVPRDVLHLLPNGFAPSPAKDRAFCRSVLGVPQKGKVIGWVGRMSEEKGVDIFIDALRELDPSEFHAVLVGDGPERSSAERLAKEMGLADRVTFCGALAGAGALMPAFDVFVLSSRTEGTPIALLEAMANLVPTVSTSVGEVPTVLDGGKYGVLVPALDPGSLGEAIKTVLDEPDLALERSALAQQHVEKTYSVDGWLDRVDRVYREAIERGR